MFVQWWAVTSKFVIFLLTSALIYQQISEVYEDGKLKSKAENEAEL